MLTWSDKFRFNQVEPDLTWITFFQLMFGSGQPWPARELVYFTAWNFHSISATVSTQFVCLLIYLPRFFRLLLQSRSLYSFTCNLWNFVTFFELATSINNVRGVCMEWKFEDTADGNSGSACHVSTIIINKKVWLSENCIRIKNDFDVRDDFAISNPVIHSTLSLRSNWTSNHTAPFSLLQLTYNSPAHFSWKTFYWFKKKLKKHQATATYFVRFETNFERVYCGMDESLHQS